MDKIFQKTIALSLVSILFIPQVTLAAWWNPLTWGKPNKPSEAKTEQPITPTAKQIVAPVQAKKEEIQKAQSAKTVSPKTSKTTPKTVVKNKPTPVSKPKPSPTTQPVFKNPILPIPKPTVAPAPITSEKAKETSTEYFTKEEANGLINSLVSRQKNLFKNERKNLLDTLSLGINTLENNIQRKITYLNTFKTSHDLIQGQNVVADFFSNYANSQLSEQRDEVLRIKSNILIIYKMIDQVLVDYDQIIKEGSPPTKRSELIAYMEALNEKNTKNGDLIDNATAKEKESHDAATKEYFNFTDKYYNDITEYLSGSKLLGSRFFGYKCLDDCSGHEQGWLWALKNKINSTAFCTGNSQSFIEGCYIFVKQAGLY